MKSRILIVLSAVIGLLSMGLVLAPPASAAQSYGWSWMDGSTSTSRTFASSAFEGNEGVIYVIAEVVPVYPVHTVLLEYYQNGRWVVEARGVTSDMDGQIALALDPMCNGSWCDGTWDYRLRILRAGSQRAATVRMQVTFVNDGSSGGGTTSYDTYLYERTPSSVSNSARYDVGTVTVNGSTWTDGMWFTLGGYNNREWIEYNVSDCWRFTARIGLDDESVARYLPVIMEIQGSSGVLGQYSLSNGSAQSISIDLSSTDRLTILVYNSYDRTGSGYTSFPVLAQPVLTCG